MSERMYPIPFRSMMNWIVTEYAREGEIFGVHVPYHASGKTLPIFGERIETPFGPAAGPNSQLAQNIIASYMAGARFFEVKTVQKMDGEELARCVPRPCILAADEGYNQEWSTELEIPQARDEYIKAWCALKILSKVYGLGDPNGFVFTREELQAIGDLAIEKDLSIVSDEIYEFLVYDGAEHISIASLSPEIKERTIVINGFSKTYAMTGWRMGYAAGPKEIISPMTKLHQYGIMSAPTMSQYAAIEALKNGDDDIAEMRDQYDMRRRLIVDGLNRLGLTCFEPEGAFYVFPSIQSTGMTSDEFCERLIYDKHVAVVPGSAFGACGEGFVRISYAYSIKHLAEALNRIGAFLKELK